MISSSSLGMDSITRGSLIHTTKISSSSSHHRLLRKKPSVPRQNLSFSLRPTAAATANSSSPKTCKVSVTLKSAASFAVLSTALLTGKFIAVAAESPLPPPTSEEAVLSTNPSAVESLRALLYQKLSDHEDEQALNILSRLTAIQPTNPEWNLLEARLLDEMGRVAEARRVYAEILSTDPLSFEALFERSVLMDRCGEGDEAVRELEKALESADSEKAAREVRLVMAQVKYLRKDVEGALEMYRELAIEDGKDYRPWFCQGVIYTLLDRNEEAREVFGKCKQLCPNKFDVEGFVQTPLSRMKVFGTSVGASAGDE